MFSWPLNTSGMPPGPGKRFEAEPCVDIFVGDQFRYGPSTMCASDFAFIAAPLRCLRRTLAKPSLRKTNDLVQQKRQSGSVPDPQRYLHLDRPDRVPLRRRTRLVQP